MYNYSLEKHLSSTYNWKQHESEQNSLFMCARQCTRGRPLRRKIPFSKIKQHGDFGLGTFDDLDGEMVMLDGNIYQITGDGCVHPVADETLTPFSCVTFFQSLTHDESSTPMRHEIFMHWLNNLLPSPNLFYAIRIEGTFSYLKARSVPKQENYRPLVEVTADQPIFEFHTISGTLAGFYTPSFLSQLSVPGLHLHFLSSDLKHGGHLLECNTQKIKANIQILSNLELSLPITLDYLTTSFERDTEKDLDQAEK